MKRKIFSVLLALVLVCSFSLVMAVPAAASHDATATVAFTDLASTQQSTASSLDIEVTNSLGSLGNVNEVVIDFSGTDFTVTGTGDPVGWTGVDAAGVITYTHATGIAPGDSVIFVPAVTNPSTLGVATNPVVTTSDAGSKAVLVASEATGEIAYEAVAIGSAGNDFTVEYLDADSYSGLSATMVGNAISVELADDGTDPTSDADAVLAVINTAATGFVTASTIAGETIVPVMSATALSGGSAVQSDKPCLLTGELVITEQLLVVDVAATPATSASLASYTIGFTTIGAIATDETITITFPAEYDLTLVVAGAVSMTVDGGPYTIGTVTVIGQVVTIPAVAEIPAEVSVVVVTIPTNVKNPPVSGNYDIAVLTTAGDHGSGEVTITPASFGVVAGTDDTVTAGTAFAVTVTALNAEDPAETDIGYIGDHFIDFTSDLGTGTIPAFELITFTAGVGTSPQYFVLTVAGEADVTIIAAEGTLTGESDVITINPATFVKFTIGGEPASVVAGVAFTPSIIVTAQDADGNTVEDYTGTVSWTSTDESAVLPAAYIFTTGDGEDNGEHTFLGSLFTLKTVGAEPQTITVTDVAAGVSQESTAITVTPATTAASIVVSASPGVIEADSSDSSTITATALDEFGNVADYDTAGLIESSLGSMGATTGFTDGVATATLTSILDEVGTATIKVTSGTLPYALTTVKLLPDIGITTITVTVDKASILNNGVDVRTITATYTDGTDIVTAAEGADYTVTFTITTGDATKVTLDPADGVVVPVAGVATVTLTTTMAPGVDAIVVTADGTGAADGTSEAITVTQGTYSIDLATGWNLISLPLIPTDPNIDTALADLKAAGTIMQLRTFLWEADVLGEKYWIPTGSDLSQMVDGQGYWIEMSAVDILVVAGSEFPAPGGRQPSYDLHAGWNLIGFKSLVPTPTDIFDYLGTAVEPNVQAIYGFEATTGVYFIPGVAAAPHNTGLVSGYGYWLALSEAGTIYP